MNIRDLKYVVALKDNLHFGRAAKACHVSQPALSGQIAKLEARLGVSLFERSKKSVRITAIGVKIAAHAEALLLIVSEIETLAHATKDPLSGPFRLGMIATIGPYLAPRILGEIHRQLPRIELTLVEGMTHDLEAALAAGRLDAVVQATAPLSPALVKKPLYDEPFLVALPEGHRLAKKANIRLDEIDNTELLLLADGHCLRDQVLGACGASAAKVNTRETSLETLLALVAAGDGVTLLPAMAARTGKLVLKPVSGAGAARQVCLTYRQSYPRPAAIDALAKIIRQAGHG
ncbi:MAG: LysR substrate-binding domain-containing protein [Rhodobacteraceae bacterium]|nr:LysR substrate-binding domain-containing protein [Paracoccaceae bacterium]